MPLLEEYPQGYWEGNQFILPTLPPPPQQEVFQAPVAAAPPPVSPLLRARPLLIQPDGGGDYMDPMDPTDPTDPTFSLSRSSPQMMFAVGPGFGDTTTPAPAPPSYDKAFTYGLLGSAIPVPGAGLLGRAIGTMMDVSDAEAALAEAFGANPPGYPMGLSGGYNPDLSFWGGFLGYDPVAEQVAAQEAHLSVAGLEGLGYGGFGMGMHDIGGEQEATLGAFGGLDIGGEGPSGGEGYGGGGESDVGGEGMDDGMGME